MIRWGLIGGSDIAATRMIPAMLAAGQRPVAVASSSHRRAQQFAEAHGIDVACPDVDDLLARDDIDAVYISSLNRLHALHTLAAAAAGRHVLCEKPVALDLADAHEMVRACESAQVVFAVNHHLPAHTTHTAIRRIVDDGGIGEIRSIRVFFAFELAERLRGWRLTDPAVGGPVLDLIPHVGSVVNKLAGSPEAVCAMTVRQGNWAPELSPAGGPLPEDAAMAVVRYPGEVMCQIDVGWSTPFARNGLEVNGTTGSLIATEVIRADPGGRVVLVNEQGRHELAFERHRDAYLVTLESFEQAVAHGSEPMVTGREGALALALTVAAAQAGRSGAMVPIAG